jgi:hypothetical protein
MKNLSIDDATPAEWDSLRVVTDPVEQPDHYNKGAIEAIEAIKASMPANEFNGYLKGNALKYLWRYDYKGKPIEDLRKCRWYIERLIKEVNQ